MARGRKGRTSNLNTFHVTLYGRDKENFCDLSKRFKSHGETVKYLLAMEKQHLNWMRAKEREKVCKWHKEEGDTGEKNMEDGMEELRCLPLTEATWNHYIKLCQKAFPTWTWQTHSQKVEAILSVAEMHYASQVRSPVPESAYQGDRNQEQIQQLETIPVTPEKANASTSISMQREPPSTPVKERPHFRPDRTPKWDGDTDGLDFGPKKEAASGNPLSGFTEIHSDFQQSVSTQMIPDQLTQAILSPLPEYHDSDHIDQTKPNSPDISHSALTLFIPDDLQERYHQFFKFYDWDEEIDETKMIMLLDFAESHPSLVPPKINLETSAASKNERQEWTRVTTSRDQSDQEESEESSGQSPPPRTKGRTNEDTFQEESEECAPLEPPPPPKRRKKTMVRRTRDGTTYINLDTTDTEDDEPVVISKMNKNVQKTNVAPRNQRLKKDRPMVQTAKLPSRLPSDDDEYSFDSDGTWADGTQPIRRKKQKRRIGPKESCEKTETSTDEETDQPDTQHDQEGSDKTFIRLLKPDYYLKFSEEARNTQPKGCKRSIAAVANTRKHIVERHQLKMLISQCACSNRNCVEKIDRRSIKILETGWTVKIKAECRGTAKHKFQWDSSAKVSRAGRQGSSWYTLNVSVQAALQLSGNNWTKMEHFAKILRLTWGGERTHMGFLNICRPVVRRCFEMTRQEMLDNLMEASQNGQIVLAGDGQFDSPGSCATVCTYTLMALGIDQKQVDGSSLLKRCAYVISQAVIDKRHADNKSTNMERVGLHWALQPIFKAGIKVAELVTDDHVQIVTDFRKIAAAAEEQKSNVANGDDKDTALTAFQESLATALLHYQPPVIVGEEIKALLTFYSDIIHSNDIWHRAKNVLKSVSTIAQSAPANEQQSYRRYAKMLRNYLWTCAEEAKGDKDKFLAMWTAIRHHLQDNHINCTTADLHTKTKLMGTLDQTTRPFSRLISCVRRAEVAAPQLCRFRNTGILESYNGLCLKYCPKRIYLTYDSMMMRRDLAALDHNHNAVRAIRQRKDGQAVVRKKYKKSTKAYSFAFEKEEKDYVYTGHLMAAILLERCQTELNVRNIRSQPSAAHPKRIQPNLAPESQRQTVEQNQAKWLSKQPPVKPKTPKQVATNSKKKRQRRVVSSSSSQSEEECQSDGSKDKEEDTKAKKRKRKGSDDEWRPAKKKTALKGKKGATKETETVGDDL